MHKSQKQKSHEGSEIQNTIYCVIPFIESCRIVKTMVTKITSVIASKYAGRGRMLTERGTGNSGLMKIFSLNGVWVT